jgi:hypothetical protein
VDHPFIKLSDLTTDGKFVPHAILQGDARKKVWVWEEGRERGLQRRTSTPDQDRRRRVTFVLVYFLYWEKESNLRP